MPRTRNAALTTRLERIEQLAHDLARDLRRGQRDGDESLSAHRAMADTISVEIAAVISALNRPTP